jgi:glucosamine-6-phosphate deaminase
VFAKDHETLSRTGATWIAQALRSVLSTSRNAVWVPSAGATPLRTYELLVADFGDYIDWSRVTVVQMDEYFGIGCADPLSLSSYIAERVVRPLGIERFVHFFDSSGNLKLGVTEYALQLEGLGGIDVAVHGIGRNGHIGFNEPGSSWNSVTRVIELQASTLDANFGDDSSSRTRYRRGVTLGLAELKAARASLLLISGRGKTDVVNRLLRGKVGTELPASSLSLCKQVTIVCDNSVLR